MTEKQTQPVMSNEELNAQALALWNNEVLGSFNSYDDDFGQFYYLNKDGTYVILLVAEADPRISPNSFMHTGVRSTFKDNPEPTKNTLLRGYILTASGGNTGDNADYQSQIQAIRVPNSVGSQVAKLFIESLKSGYEQGNPIVAVRGQANEAIFPIKIIRGKKKIKNGERVEYAVSYASRAVGQDILEKVFALPEAIEWEKAHEIYEKINFRQGDSANNTPEPPVRDSSNSAPPTEEMVW